MAQVTLIALEMVSAGYIRCRMCSQETVVRECGILLWENPSYAMVESWDNDLLHRCGRELEWWCPHCEANEYYEWGRGFDRRFHCRFCREVMTQRLKP